MANTKENCRGCKYNTPKTQGGRGRLCDGFTQPIRCPDWAINEYIRTHTHSMKNPFRMSYISAFMRGEIN